MCGHDSQEANWLARAHNMAPPTSGDEPFLSQRAASANSQICCRHSPGVAPETLAASIWRALPAEDAEPSQPHRETRLTPTELTTLRSSRP